VSCASATRASHAAELIGAAEAAGAEADAGAEAAAEPEAAADPEAEDAGLALEAAGGGPSLGFGPPQATEKATPEVSTATRTRAGAVRVGLGMAPTINHRPDLVNVFDS